jgi:2-hydroxy-6-oxonona-2,4-dienedioate hydrolase
MPQQIQRDFVAAAGIKTFYVKAGDGPPILLIHGASPGVSSLVTWRLNIEALAAEGFTVYAWDQPGFGHTDNPADFSVEFRVNHAKQFIEKLQLARFHVIGNSVGGYIAARLALEDRRVAGFITTTSGSLSPKGSADSQALSKKHSQELAGYQPTLENMRTLTLGTIYHENLVTDDLVRERYAMSTGKNHEAHLSRSKMPAPRPIYDDLQKLGKRALLLWGYNDRGVSVERGLELFRRIPGAEFHLFDRCAHWVQWDQAERFNTLCADFLRERA